MKHAHSDTRPYAPSYIDRFMDYIEDLPVPYWLTYATFFALQNIFIHILAWIVGWLDVFTFNPLMLIFPIWLWGPLAIMTHLRSVSQEALVSFSPLLEIEEEGLQKLKYEFSTMPGRSVILSGIAWVVVYVLLTYLAYDSFYVAYQLGPLLSAVSILVGLISYFFGGTIYYYSLRQLKLVNHTVKMAAQFNLFRLEPVYAFSRLTSQIGITWMALLSSTILLFPTALVTAPVYFLLALQVVFAVAAFVLPLWFVNRRLVAEKRRLLAEHNQRVEAALGRLHHSLDENGSGDEEQLYYAMTSLTTEQSVLAGIPTWPWRTGTLAGFLSAIGLPIILFLLQLVIEKWFGG